MKFSEIYTPEFFKDVGIHSVNIDVRNKEWTRVFVKRSDGCSIGRLTFKFGNLYYYKWYKSKLSGPNVSLDESDEIQSRFEWRVRTGKALSHRQYHMMIPLAKKRGDDRYAGKVKIRAGLRTHNNSGKKMKRRGLTPPSIRNEMFKLIGEQIIEFNKTGEINISFT